MLSVRPKSSLPLSKAIEIAMEPLSARNTS